MIALIEVIVGIAWVFGPNGFLIEQQFETATGLPSAWVQPVAANNEVVFHRRQDWPMAFYRSPDATDRAQVVLFAPYYLYPDGLMHTSDMPVDVAEYFFHALLEARLEDEMHRDGSSFAKTVARRADELMPEVPESHRSSAYLAASADFGAHLLSIANEILRADLRQAASGRSLCKLIEAPASLFGLWHRSFDRTDYPGRYLLDHSTGKPTSESAETWITTKNSLARSDKQIFVREILGVDWVGDPTRDFDGICPGDQLTTTTRRTVAASGVSRSST